MTDADHNNPNTDTDQSDNGSDLSGRSQPEASGSLASAIDKPVNTISLYLPGLNEPLVITGKDSITFGRRDAQNNIIPTVDLSTNYGALLGVSRMHAEILFRDDGCFIEDLNSSNGTWVNERKIDPHDPFPLRNGDQVRLGQLLMIVYMSSLQQPASGKKTTRLSENILHLVDPGTLHGKRGYTPSYLRDVVVPLIVAIDQINNLLVPESETLLITNVTLEPSSGELRVGVTRGAEKLVLYLREKLPELLEQMSSGATAPLTGMQDMIVQDLKRTMNPNADEAALSEAVDALLKSRLRFATSDKSKSGLI